MKLHPSVLVPLVFLLIAFSSIANALTLDDLIALNEEFVEKISNNISYVYDIKTTVFPRNGEQYSQEAQKVHGWRMMYRRSGNRYFSAKLHRGIHSTMKGFAEELAAPSKSVFIEAFDGETRRTNTITQEFLAFYRRQDEDIISDPASFDRLFQRDRENKTPMDRRPAGNQRHPTGKEYMGPDPRDPALHGEDFYLEGVVFMPGLPIRRTTWLSKFRESTAELISQSGNRTVVRGSMLSYDDLRKFLPDASTDKIGEILDDYTYEATLDLSKGASIVGVKIARSQAGGDGVQATVELKDLSMSYDRDSDIWFPTHFVWEYRHEAQRKVTVVDLLSFSSEPIPQDRFQNIWFDEQHVWDEDKQRYVSYLLHDLDFYQEDSYDKDASLEQQLRALSNEAFADIERNVVAESVSPPGADRRQEEANPGKPARPERVAPVDSVPGKVRTSGRVAALVAASLAVLGVGVLVRLKKRRNS